MTNQVLFDIVAPPDRDWTIDISGRTFGLRQWGRNHTEFIIVDYFGAVPFSAPVTVAAWY